MKLKYLFYRCYRYIPRKYGAFKWFLQRGKNGYADCDLWDLDGYLAKLISNSVRDLAENGYGYQCVDHHTGEEGKDHESCPQLYREMLLELANGFKIYVDKEDCENYKVCNVWWWDRGGCELHPKAKYDHSWELLVRWFPSLWD